MLVTKNEVTVCNNSTRLVRGGRGNYYEFTTDQAVRENIYMPEDQRWRAYDGAWKDKVYYLEYRTTDGVKLYYQRKTVNYADYKPGYWYVAENSVTQEKS